MEWEHTTWVNDRSWTTFQRSTHFTTLLSTGQKMWKQAQMPELPAMTRENTILQRTQCNNPRGIVYMWSTFMTNLTVVLKWSQIPMNTSMNSLTDWRGFSSLVRGGFCFNSIHACWAWLFSVYCGYFTNNWNISYKLPIATIIVIGEQFHHHNHCGWSRCMVEGWAV